MTSQAGESRPTSAPRLTKTRYTWFPEYVKESPSVFADGGQYPGYVISLAVIGGVLMLPPVTAATGVSATNVLRLIGLHFVVCSINIWLVGPLARRSRLAFRVGVVTNLAVGLTVTCGFPALGGDPNTMLWNLTILYACLNGTLESRPSWFLLSIHTLAPLLTIPAFDWQNDVWGLAGPLLTAGISAGSYHFMATATGSARGLREWHEATLTELREQREELARMRLARDLHDSVGSTLGLLALHADLLERHRNDPEQVRRFAALTREAARGGLDDLRGVLEAITPQSGSPDHLAAALTTLAERTAPGVAVDFTLDAARPTTLAPEVRLTLVRFFQEALSNAVRHGRATRLRVSLSVADELVMEIADDGSGFDPETVTRGRGLAGMNTRAEELGGLLEVLSAPGEGTRLRLVVPPKTAPHAA